MRIVEIYVGRFGSFEDRRVGPFGPGLTLVRGNNEEGKTTLVELVRALCFGFRERSAPNPYIPRQGGGRMGALEVEGIDGSLWRIERAEGPRGGRVTVLSAQRSESSLDVLLDLLHRTDRRLFESVFAFGLKELEEIESLHSKEVQGRIMGAAAGTGNASPVDIWRKLMEQARGLFKPAGKTQPVGRAIRALYDVEAEIHKIRNLPAQYAALSREREEAWRKREEARDQLARVQENLVRCQKLANMEPAWRELLKVEAHIKELEPAAYFPPDGTRRLEEILGRIRSSREMVEALNARIGELQKELDRPIPHLEIIPLWPEIDALAQRATALASLPDEMGKAQGKEASDYQNIIAALNAAGDGWEQERALRFDASASTEQLVIKWESRLREAQENSRRGQDRLESAANAFLQKKRAMEDAEKALSDEIPLEGFPEEPIARDRLEEWLRFHDRAKVIEDRLKALKAELDEAMHDYKEISNFEFRTSNLILPGWFPLALLMVFMVAAGLAAWAGSMPMAALIAASGLAASVLASWFRGRLMEESRARLMEARAQQEGHQQRLDRRVCSLREGLREASEKLTAAQRQMSLIGKELLGRDEISEEEARAALARARAMGEKMSRRQALHLQVQQIRKEVERAQEDCSKCEGDLERLRNMLHQVQGEWESWQKERGLNGELTPGSLRILLQSIREFQQAHHRWEESKKTVEHWKAIWDRLFCQAAELLKACGREGPDGYEILGSIRNLREDCRTAQEACRRRQELEERVHEYLVQMNEARKRLQEDEAERERLLAGARVEDEDSFRAMEPLAQQRQDLIAHMRELLASLQVGLEQPDEESLRSILQAVNWGENRLHLDEQASNFEKLGDLVDSLGENIGRLDQEIRSMEQSDRLSYLLQQREQAYAQLQENAWTWATITAAAAFLDLTRHKYETQRQPAVIRWASEIFRQMTDGAFVDIRLPLDTTFPRILRASGELVPTEHLSRGTAEQLYLSIRMALISEYVRQAGPLPVLMDDILANFDPQRGRAAAQTIAEFSCNIPIQVIFFTCHPHIVRYFQNLPNPPDILDIGNLLQ